MILKRSHTASILFFIFFLVVMVIYRDFNITVDEPLHKYYGESIVNYYLSLGRDNSFHKLYNLKFYGPFFDLTANIFYRIFPSIGSYESIHLLCALSSIFGLFYLYKIASFWFRDNFAVLLVAITFLSPFYFNSSFNQPKDIPFASFFIASSYFLLRISMIPLAKIPLKVLIYLGIFMGITNAIRSLGFLLFLFFLSILAYNLFHNWKDISSRKKIIKRGIAIGSFAFLVLTIFFPYLHKSPIRNYIETILIFSQFPHSMDYLYWGETINSLDTPRSYILSFLLIKTPEYILAGFLFTFFFLSKNFRKKLTTREIRILKKILGGFLAILFLLIATKPVLYDPRQFLFLYPFFYLLSIFLFRSIFKYTQLARIPVYLLLFCGILYSIFCIYLYHPSQSSYYNSLVSKPLGKQYLFDINILNTQYRIQFLQDYHANNDKENRKLYLYNGEDDEWSSGLSFIGMDSSVLQEFKKIFPFPLKLRQEKISYYLPPGIEFTSNIENADFILGEDLVSFKKLNIEKEFNDIRGEIDFLNVYQLKK